MLESVHMNRLCSFLLCALAAFFCCEANAAELLWEFVPGKKKIQVNKAGKVKIRFLNKQSAEVHEGLIHTGDENRLLWVQKGRNVSMDEAFTMVVTLEGALEDSGEWPVIFTAGENAGFNIKPTVATRSGTYTVNCEGYDWFPEKQTFGGKVSNRLQTYRLTHDGRGVFRLYVEGEEVGSITVDETYARKNAKVELFSLGGRPLRQDNLCPVSVRRVRFYRGIQDDMGLFLEDYSFWLYGGGGVLLLLILLLGVIKSKKASKSKKGVDEVE